MTKVIPREMNYARDCIDNVDNIVIIRKYKLYCTLNCIITYALITIFRN